MLKMPDRQLPGVYQIDTNRINSRQNLEHMNRLEGWRESGVILLGISRTARDEAAAGNDVRRTRKANSYVYSESLPTTSHEMQRLSQIERILFPNGCKSQNQRNDVDIVFNAIKYGEVLITADGASHTQPSGILGTREELARLGAKILRDDEAISHIEDQIHRRDERARKISKITGQSLPHWVGQD